MENSLGQLVLLFEETDSEQTPQYEAPCDRVSSKHPRAIEKIEQVFREQANRIWCQRELAHMAGVSESTVYRVVKEEGGKHGISSWKTGPYRYYGSESSRAN